MASDDERKIIKQIEYYFGDVNLSRDKFLKEKIKEDDGWVTLEVLLTFKRLAALTTDPEVIAKALEKSEEKLVVVSEDRKKVRRDPEKPLPANDEERKKELTARTAYAKGFPLDETLDNILAFLEPYDIEHVTRRTTKDRKFKGSCFITFKSVESCKKFLELKDLKYKDTELIKKFQEDYHKAKRQEYEERKLKKAKKVKVEEAPKQIKYPKSATLYFSGLKEGDTLTREDLKERVKEIGDKELSFVDFNKGDLEGYMRFPEENDAVEFHKKLEDGEVEIKGFKLKLRVLEGEEEEAYLKKTSNTVIELRKKQKEAVKGKKRKGNFNHNHGRDREAKQKNKKLKEDKVAEDD